MTILVVAEAIQVVATPVGPSLTEVVIGVAVTAAEVTVVVIKMQVVRGESSDFLFLYYDIFLKLNLSVILKIC
jgi:hypothetical protein